MPFKGRTLSLRVAGGASLLTALRTRWPVAGAGAPNATMNWPPFRPDTRHNLEGLRLSSSTGLCLTTTNVSN